MELKWDEKKSARVLEPLRRLGMVFVGLYQAKMEMTLDLIRKKTLRTQFDWVETMKQAQQEEEKE